MQADRGGLRDEQYQQQLNTCLLRTVLEPQLAEQERAGLLLVAPRTAGAAVLPGRRPVRQVEAVERVSRRAGRCLYRAEHIVGRPPAVRIDVVGHRRDHEFDVADGRERRSGAIDQRARCRVGLERHAGEPRDQPDGLAASVELGGAAAGCGRRWGGNGLRSCDFDGWLGSTAEGAEEHGQHGEGCNPPGGCIGRERPGCGGVSLGHLSY